MRHVSRTHRVFRDRIYLDSKIQTRCIDTKHQIADILTKGNFTRVALNNLLYLFWKSSPESINLTSSILTRSSSVKEVSILFESFFFQ